MPTLQEQGIYAHGAKVTQSPTHGGLVPAHGGKVPVHGTNNYDPAPNLITNGDGSTIAGWVNVSGGAGSLSIVGGRLRIAPTAAGGQWVQQVTVVAGATYQLTAELYPHQAGLARIDVDSVIRDFPTYGANINYTFVPAGTNIQLGILAADQNGYVTTGVEYAEFDNIVLKRIS